MNADNYIGIWKCKDGKFRGYDLCASNEYPNIKIRPKWKPLFTAETLEEACIKAQKEYAEYGFHFMNI